MTDIVPAKKYECEGLAFEVEVLTPMDPKDILDPERIELANAIADVDAQIDICQAEVQKLDAEIDRLTNHADGLDYAVAVASGLITGLIDSFFGEEIKKLTDKKINNAVINSAKKQKIEATIKKAEEGARAKGTTLSDKAKKKIMASVEKEFSADTETQEKHVLAKAIRYMEKNHASPTDKAWNYKGSSVTAASHHLDDLSHHASIIGLGASIITQFTKKGYFIDNTGHFVDKSNNGSKIPIVVDENNQELFGKTIPSKIVCGTLNWFWHLASDVAGTSNNPGAGMGVPGPLMSLIKSFSALPGIRNTKLPQIANELFKKDPSGKNPLAVHFDFRSEVAQSIPVLMNELIVRVFYAVRRFIDEYKEKQSISAIEWKKVLPFNNRTIARMMTISTATFVAVDAADAAIRSGGFNPACLMRINFVGIGRFAVALGTDIGMGIKRNRLLNERIHVMSQQLALYNAKVYYKCAQIHYAEMDMLEAETDMWLEAADTETALQNTYELAEVSVVYVSGAIAQINSNLAQISTYRDDIEKLNPGLNKRLVRILKY